MPNFAPTEEQEEIRRLANSIAIEHLRQQARSSEKNGDISPELMATIAQTGLTTPFPEEYGGSGSQDAVTLVLIAEELGFGDGALAMNIIGSMMGPLTVSLSGNEQQRRLYLPPFADEREGHQRRGSLAWAERTGGYAIADIATTVRSNGQQYAVNGIKRDVLHGGRSHPRVVLARLEGTVGNDGLCAFVLPEEVAHLTRLRITDDVQKLGLIAAPSASYTFEEVPLPADAILGEPGSTGVVCAATLYGLLRGGVACGLARAALEYARDYARDRVAFGRPIASYQGIAFIVAEMAMKLDAARLLLWHAATQWDRGVDTETLVHDAEAAQYQALKIAKSATIDAIQVMGGAGFMQDYPAEMWMRNAAAME